MSRQRGGTCKLCWATHSSTDKEHLRSQEHGDLMAEAAASRDVRRFWSNVQKSESGCWEWIGPRYPTGYGNSKTDHYAHRKAYRLVVGEIPAGLQLDHLCRNRACVNPAHLEPVTCRENIMRSPISPTAINARKTRCYRGHPFDEANTRIDGRGYRVCRTCHRENRRVTKDLVRA